MDIPNETNPDHRRFHGRHGEVIAVIPRRPASDASDDDDLLGEPKYRVQFDDGGYGDLRWYDLRPPIVE